MKNVLLVLIGYIVHDAVKVTKVGEVLEPFELPRDAFGGGNSK